MWPTDSTERLLAFQREVNRLFRRFFDEARKDRSKQPLAATDALKIPVDVYDHGNSLVVEVEAAGVPKEALQLTVSRDLIVVEGRKPAEARGKVQYHCMERDFGEFRQVIEIPAPINAGELKAVYRAGVLIITAPKIVEDRRGARRQVDIEDGEG